MTENGRTYFTRASAIFLQGIVESLSAACADRRGSRAD